MSGFVHLRVHSEYSLVDGVVRVKPLVKAVAELGMPAVGITDQGNLFAMVKFYTAALGAGIKPIVGADIWIDDPDAKEKRSRLTLLCRNMTGYRALSRLLSRSYQEGQHQGYPVVERSWIEQDCEGLIALSGAREGDVGRLLLAGDFEAAERRLDEWLACFPNAYYLELQRTGRADEEDYLVEAVQLAVRTNTPVVATNDVRFISGDDFEAHEARVCIHDGRTLDDPRRPRNYSDQQYLRSAEEMQALFSDIPEALENTVAIARRCNLALDLFNHVLPDFPIPAGMTIDEYLRQESHRGLEERFELILKADDPDIEAEKQAYRARLDLELDVITQMGFPGYFLIVADFIQWAKEQDIPVGPGRGSGAGSLVAYALKITDLDPIKYDLLFERFLNPERVSMPDFDVDFCMDKRDRVIDYVADKYGREKVSQIATHGTMAARAVVRDVGRVLGHPYGFVDRIAKLIPFEIGMTLEKALEQEEELRDLYERDEEVSTLLDLARKLEGLSRNVGKHAGGVVIAPTDLTDFSPLYCEPGGQGLATQYDKDDVEAVGLVKFDFLGLRTLTLIDWTVKAVNAMREKQGEPPIDMTLVPLDDRATFDLLKKCQTTAVFQLESRGMKDLIRRLQPDSFEDIVALVALFRPGPLQSGMVDDFIDRKHGRAKVAYPTPELHHDDLEPILKPTYGVVLYQEQVMQIAQALGGYSLGGADLLRRAMGKKKAEEMAKQRQIFLEGAAANGINETHAGGIFDLMETFAGYGFNKSHSAAYALLSYHTAWLKAHYPAPFMAAVLSSDMDNTDKVVTLIEECRVMKLRVLPPSVNRSIYRFRAGDEKTVVYGLGAVKGVGQGAIDSIVEERNANGEYKDVFDLCRRVDPRKVNRRVLEVLVKAGCFDDISVNRATVMSQVGEALQMADQAFKASAAGQNDLFGLEAPSQPDPAGEPSEAESRQLPEWDELERLNFEKETLGLYLTGHPVTPFEADINRFVSARLNTVAQGGNRDSGGHKGRGRNKGKQVTVAGLVVALRTRNTASGARMGFITLDDRTGRIDAIVFPEAYNEYRQLLVKDRLLVVSGTLDYDDFIGGFRITTEKVFDLEEAREKFARRLIVRLPPKATLNGVADELRETLTPYRNGHCPVIIDYDNGQARARLKLGEAWRVKPCKELLSRLKHLSQGEDPALEY